MLYILLIIMMAGLVYGSWRLMRAMADRPGTRVIGPDDDPDFLRRMGTGDADPRS